ncbi:nuclear transport factor 2 family protein [Flavivirga spongiicola]|uniref:Nuclear transport factor 2 family protein n=1 Tax=Flavivirga spongiicola TaxID=421621 RepID=A0ABU7XT74_9FLAO|nr:nuclear transport factor 2 family protein [Flavivirga sp. MEBiC05379]MDO5978958.1 nuclear transport factor 2 family protein [Flavivirga sp. MEBiC05379]
MKKTALEILEVFQQSISAQTPDWMDLMDENIVFQGPVDKVEGKEANINLHLEFGKLIRGHELLSITGGENIVSTQVILKIETPSGKIIALDIAEFYTIEEGKIKAMKIYYDPTEYKKEFNL